MSSDINVIGLPSRNQTEPLARQTVDLPLQSGVQIRLAHEVVVPQQSGQMRVSWENCPILERDEEKWLPVFLFKHHPALICQGAHNRLRPAAHTQLVKDG